MQPAKVKAGAYCSLEISTVKNQITYYKHIPCVYYIKDYLSSVFACRQLLISSMVDSVSSLSEWNHLNGSPNDTARMYNWLYETKFLA